MPSNSTCALCNRGPQRANKVSHSKRRSPRRQKVNIQSREIPGGGKAPICTKCTRTLSRVK